MQETDETAISKWLVIAGRQISQHLGQQLAELGISASQYIFLLKIHELPGITQKDLVAKEFLDPSNVTRAIKQLEAQGLVTRVPDPSDKRAFLLTLTAQGEALYPKIRALLDAEEQLLRDEVGQAVPGFDAQRFLAALQIIGRLHGDTDKEH
ncbi:MarR family winged helix-turn-helix transcriptional regulator [Lacticaseibacillus mingshuiensis]|uniref:MarR family winged helix-turn-helix transcriptional regulator n=1 Tax=Lacticaseibacillus mingshuiensis TaxID=2799574 RepID=A0ABW4CJB1_9LACO|nr:MarR family transcriptional regulator [Lacticaseibacillus mingshuiensis]